MKRLLLISAALAPVVLLAAPGGARAQAIFPGSGPGYGSGYTNYSGIAGYSGYSRTAASQTPFQATPRPAFSPYLELLRGGSPAANYFLGVVPSQRPNISSGPLPPDVSQIVRP